MCVCFQGTDIILLQVIIIHKFVHYHKLIPLLPSGKMQLMECDTLGVVGQAGFAKNKINSNEGFIHK